MPNWIDQDLHVVGSEADVARFERTGYSPRNSEQADDLLIFAQLCPLRRGEPETTYTPESGLVLVRVRTRTQALFGMVTAWLYPETFYAGLAKHWPELSFICSVNEEMGSFGGIVMVLDGKVTDLVRDYGVRGYSRAAHARQVRAAIKRWARITSSGRDWRVIVRHSWDRGRMPFDAHFDDDFWFYFKTREELMRCRKRYRTSRPQRRVNGRWQRTR